MCLTEPDVHSDDHYQVLGVKRSAADKDISAAYKRLALRYHPDKNPDDRDQAELVFKRITHAYDILRDAAKRKKYDNSSSKSCFVPSANNYNNYGEYGSFDRADSLYRAFFGADAGMGGSTASPNINIAGIFNFDPKPQAKVPNVPGSKLAEATHLIAAGTPIAIHGLANKPELNGKSAKVKEWNASKCRYEVTLASGDVLSLRPRNITQLCHVKVTSHENQPELNGKIGEVVDFNEETGCYVVLLEDPASIIELSPKNCIFNAGTAGVLEGLSDQQLSGKMCSIVSVDHNACRYVVQCEGGRQLKVRFEKVMC